MDEWVTQTDLAMMLRVTTQTVRNARKQGKITEKMIRVIGKQVFMHAEACAAAMGRSLPRPEDVPPRRRRGRPPKVDLLPPSGSEVVDVARPLQGNYHKPEGSGKRPTSTAEALNEAKLRTEEERGKLLELERREREKELVPAEMALAAQAQIARRVVAAVLSVPSRFQAVTPSLTREQRATLKDMLREALEEIAEHDDDTEE